MMRLTAKGIVAQFDASIGLIASFCVTEGGRDIAPLHRAPWVGHPDEIPDDAAPHIAKLSGDFFCAPFGQGVDGSPMHGWPANARWDLTDQAPGRLRATLSKRVLGAQVEKELTLRDHHPFVYQRHSFSGGQTRISVANHANVSVPNGAFLRTSPKRLWETPTSPQESDPARGRSALRYPAQAVDPKSFPGVDGPVDLTQYPWAPQHEDFVLGLEADGTGLGWTAVTRPQERDLYLSLRNPRRLPMTMLWHSNGGRDFAPWSGRHRGCLGVEEGAAAHMLGLSNKADLAGPGAVTLTPDDTVDVRHVIGALDWPSGAPVATVTMDGPQLTVTGDDGATRKIPFDAAFLQIDPAA